MKNLRKTLVVVVLMLAIAISVSAYALAAHEGKGADNNQEGTSDVTTFEAVVNGMRSVNVSVCIDLSDGVSKEEAELIAEATFTQVMGENVIHQLDALSVNETQIQAHHKWGYNENDMGHVFEMTVDLTTLKITVSHCF